MKTGMTYSRTYSYTQSPAVSEISGDYDASEPVTLTLFDLRSFQPFDPGSPPLR